MATEDVRRIKMPVGELGDVDVLRISLVDRGANRVPFRITKREGPSEEGQDVLDFYKHFRKDAAEKSGPQAQVAAIAVSAEADVEKASELVKAAGFSVEKAIKSDEGHTAFVQGDGEFDPEKCTYLKFDELRGAYLSGDPAVSVQKRASADFGENLGAQQFIPGMFLAQDALHSTISNILDDPDTGRDDAVSAIKAATQKFSEFVGDLAEKIPADVFKLEKAFDAEDSEPEAEPKDDKVEAGEKPEDAKKSEAPEEKETEAKKGEGEGDDTPDDGKKTLDKSEPKEDESKDTILKAIEGLSGQLKDLTAKVDEAKNTADEARALAQKAESRSTAVGGSPAGDPELRFQRQNGGIQKGESIPLLDTAFGDPD